MLNTRKSCPIIFLLSTLTCSVIPAKADPSMASLKPNARQVFLASMSWGDRYWDSQTKFLGSATSSSNDRSRTSFTVRGSSWYALGLLLRNQQGDTARAIDILNAVLAQQYDEPGKPWDGTFRRTPDEPEPPANAVMWHDFDPNWREFIGTTFAMVLEEFPDRIPANLAHRMDNSIVRAVAGEIHEGRLVPNYTNPALMYGFLWNFAAVRNHRPEWIAQSTAWQQNVYDLYKQHDTFYEFNSPTYCGVDLYALGLWRNYGSTPQIRAMGREMEAGLWQDLAAFYDADLRNISGPFDRAYGMDMTHYVSVVGLALRMVLPADLAPFPPIHPPLAHGGDLWFAPQFAILGVHIPTDALRTFHSFSGPRLVRKRITNQRIATAWIGRNLMYGGEITDKTVGTPGHTQFHAATVQWRTPSGTIGWVQLIQTPPLDAVAGRHSLTISCSGDVRFRIHAPGINAVMLKQTKWMLPGLVIYIHSDAKSFASDKEGHNLEAEYSGITGMTLTFDRQPPSLK